MKDSTAAHWDFSSQANPLVASDAPLPADGAGVVVAFRLKGKDVLIVNGGYEAISRLLSCLDALARITFISPAQRLHPKVRQILDVHPLRHLIRYHDRELDVDVDLDLNVTDWSLVLSCYEPEDEDPERSRTRTVYQACKKRRIVVNCADVPECCDFHLPTTIRDGPLQISVSTSGFAPGLARRIKKTLTSSIEPGSGRAVMNCGKLREALKARGVERNRRMKIMAEAQRVWKMEKWATLNQREADEMADRVQAGGDLIAPGEESGAPPTTKSSKETEPTDYNAPSPLASRSEPEIQLNLASRPASLGIASNFVPLHSIDSILPTPSFSHFSPASPSSQPTCGTILLLGGGPGHPSHLTLATMWSLLRADHVVSDRLVGPILLDWVPGLRDKVTFVAEKSGSGGKSDTAQDEANETCLAKLRLAPARSDGLPPLVARLKNGDPFLFARGMEEVAWFTSRGVPVAVAPGVPSAISAAMAGGVAVTHRGVADCVEIITARGERGAMPVLPEWIQGRTAVVLMGLGRLDDICTGFVSRGWDTTCPVTVVQKAWWEAGLSGESASLQKVVRGTLENVPGRVREAGLESPVVVVVGEVSAVVAGVWRGVGPLAQIM
ncbi:hypothetical protein HDU93_009773 [Gonapodya sp. JEL0774]|nr:hypothetical protein HDU93_009773 [Gonapodya sp. JEL0774]